MELLLHSIKLDWPVLLPILICSILQKKQTRRCTFHPEITEGIG